ncbi:MAG TPA: allantoinase AllB [Thermoleophilia bacterium]|nr:allantoinase AllB [Thermoleophilia bacterium]
MKTAICGGQVVFEDGVGPATILIGEDGTIDAVSAVDEAPETDDVIDASGLHVFPGAVDPHTHLNDPGSTASEDFFSGTCGAAAGGVTTVVEMPQTVPIVIDRERFLEKQAIARQKAVVDFALWGALTADNVREGGSPHLRDLAAEGAIAFKAFTSESPEQPRIADRLLAEAMREVTALGLLVGVHCEDQPLIDFYTATLLAEGRNDALVNPDSRPAVVEIEAVRRVLLLGELVGARLHLAHVSHPASFDLVREAKAQGADVTAETCAHYLKLTRDDVERVGSYAMCNPPLRDAGAREGLWSRLAGGYIDCIGSDHCAYTEEEKANPDFWQMPAGISGLQVMFPLVVGEAAEHGVGLPLLASAFSGNPARRFGLYPKKGAIRPGSDADLVFVDLDAPWQVRGAELFSKAPGTAYEGSIVKARVRRTLVRGRSVFVDPDGSGGRILVDPGFGAFLRPGRTG